jgi:photosystem II stability/assembly factor-like uncharacterized protein
MRCSAAVLAHVALLAGCAAQTPTVLRDCQAYAGRSFDITHLATSSRGGLFAGGIYLQVDNCYVGVAGWRYRPAIFHSTDRGDSWAGGTLPVDTAGLRESQVVSIAAAPDGSVYAAVTMRRGSVLDALADSAAYEGKLFRSPDGGATWNVLPDPLGSATMSIATGSRSQLFANVCGDAGGVFRSDDQGASWTFTGLRKRYCDDPLFVDSSGSVYAFASGGEGLGFYQSTDDGTTWIRLAVPPGHPEFSHHRIAANDEGLLVITVTSSASGGTAFYRSTDHGFSWTRMVTPDDEWVRALAVGKGGEIYFETSNVLHLRGGLFRSGDAGQTWEKLPYLEIPAARGTTFVIDGEGVLYGGWYGTPTTQPPGTYGGRIRRSIDHGRTWQEIKALPR